MARTTKINVNNNTPRVTQTGAGPHGLSGCCRAVGFPRKQQSDAYGSSSAAGDVGVARTGSRITRAMQPSAARGETSGPRPIRQRGSSQPSCWRSGRARACLPASTRQAGGLNVTVPRRRSGTVDRIGCSSSGFVLREHGERPCALALREAKQSPRPFSKRGAGSRDRPRARLVGRVPRRWWVLSSAESLIRILVAGAG